MSKTVCGVGYYVDDDRRRATHVDAARARFDGLLDANSLTDAGQVLLGTPLGRTVQASMLDRLRTGERSLSAWWMRMTCA